MPLNPRNIINSRFGINLGLWIGRVMPPRMGKQLAHLAANFIASHADWDLVRAVRANRWVLSGETLQGDELDQAVRKTFEHTASTLFDLYHFIRRPQAMRQMLVTDARSEAIIYRPQFEARGLMVVGLHLGNFDFALQVIARMGLQGLVLTLPELPGGYQMQYDIRRQTGMNLVPASVASLKRAVEYMRDGGMVVTGADRPEPGASLRPMFFNRPSALPVHYAALAIKANVPVVVGCTLPREDGKYHLFFSDPIEMQPHANHKHEILLNAEAVLKVAEGYIRNAPEQWAMTFPVWPEALDQVPG